MFMPVKTLTQVMMFYKLPLFYEDFYMGHTLLIFIFRKPLKKPMKDHQVTVLAFLFVYLLVVQLQLNIFHLSTLS